MRDLVYLALLLVFECTLMILCPRVVLIDVGRLLLCNNATVLQSGTAWVTSLQSIFHWLYDTQCLALVCSVETWFGLKLRVLVFERPACRISCRFHISFLRRLISHYSGPLLVDIVQCMSVTCVRCFIVDWVCVLPMCSRMKVRTADRPLL